MGDAEAVHVVGTRECKAQAFAEEGLLGCRQTTGTSYQLARHSCLSQPATHLWPQRAQQQQQPLVAAVHHTASPDLQHREPAGQERVS